MTLVSAIPLQDGGIQLKWTKSEVTDFLCYRIYFTNTLGEWEASFSHKGQSPIEYKSQRLSDDGYCFINLYELHRGTEYYFKITVLDTDDNESEFSNMVSAIIK